MTKVHPGNARAKRKYFVYLKDACGLSEASVASVAKALDRFEQYTHGKDFGAYHYEQARAFKRHLASQLAERTKKPISVATQVSTLTELRKFFRWLAGQPGYRSRLTYADADYFNPSEKDSRIAKAERSRPCPTIEQISHTMASMPSATEIDRRNRAMIALTILTGARDGALASLKLKHIDVADRAIWQDAREVRTKFSKTFYTWFFPVGEEFVQVVEDWVAFLRADKLWGNDDPLFPATEVAADADRGFYVAGLKRVPWSNASPIRKVFKEAFEGAGLPYFNPHSFRNTLVLLGEEVCKTVQELKAWSQNLGHEHMLTTLLNYGTVADHHQKQLIRSMADRKSGVDGNWVNA